MSDVDPEIVAARARASLARGRLSAALSALKDRLLPRAIARRVGLAIADKGAEAATSAGEVVKARPALVAGVVGLAALFLARKPIRRAISSTEEATDTEPARLPDRPARKGKS